MAYDQFVEPIGNKGLLHVSTAHFTHFVNVNRKADTPPFSAEDMVPWSRKAQIQQTGQFDSKEELLARLNG